MILKDKSRLHVINGALAYGCLLLFAVGALLVLGLELFQDYEDTLNLHLKRAESLSMLFEHDASQTLQLVESAIRVLAQSSEDPLDVVAPSLVAKRFNQALSHQPSLRSLSLVGANQRIVASSNAANVGLVWPMSSFHLIDKDADAQASLLLGAPQLGRDLVDARQAAVGSPISNLTPYVIPVALRFGTRDHPFWVIATINPDHWVNTFSRQILKGFDTFQLVRFDGLLLAQQSDLPVGIQFQPNSLLLRIQTDELGTVTKDERLLAFRSSTRYPIFITLDVDKSLILQEWHIKVMWTLLSYALGIALLLLLTSWLVRRIKREEAALVLERTRMAAVYDVLPVGIALTDPAGNIIDCNPEAQGLLVLSKETHMGQSFYRSAATFLNADGQPMAQHEFPEMQALANQSPVFDFVMQCVMLEKPVWLSVSAISVAHPQFGVAISYVNISEQKAKELVLNAAKAAADKANLAKSEFLATMSHELRTPLNGMLGMAQLLAREGVAEEDRIDFAKTIISSGRVLGVLLGDLLDLSQMDANKLQLRPELCHVGDLVHELVLLFTPVAQEKGLAMDATWLGPADRYYRVDAIRLRQMMTNLISNAIKFTPSGFVRIQAQEVECVGAEAVLEFSVQDSGVGIALDKQDQLFTKFSQIENNAAHFSVGSGLGLSIVKGLAHRMGGQAGVESQLGQGSRFWFQIQVVVEQEAGKETLSGSLSNGPWMDHLALGAVMPVLHATAEVVDGAGAVALVVDDNPINQKVIAQFLKEIDISALCVVNGREAVDAIHHGLKPRFILMDVQMPVMDGLEATRQIREWEMVQALPRTPIIGLTAGAADGDKGKCLESGMDDVLFKPVDLDQLETMIIEKECKGAVVTAHVTID
jgi:signal transduction histidine kinase/CheY-like chemotaxis protein